MDTKVISVNIEGVPLKVYYSFIGEYYPATNEQPEEFPELSIASVHVEDSKINIYWLLADWQLEVIDSKIWANGYD